MITKKPVRNKATGMLCVNIYTTCPGCEDDIDLMVNDVNAEGYMWKIINRCEQPNGWESLGIEVECPHLDCGTIFIFDKMVY